MESPTTNCFSSVTAPCLSFSKAEPYAVQLHGVLQRQHVGTNSRIVYFSILRCFHYTATIATISSYLDNIAIRVLPKKRPCVEKCMRRWQPSSRRLRNASLPSSVYYPDLLYLWTEVHLSLAWSLLTSSQLCDSWPFSAHLTTRLFCITCDLPCEPIF